MKYLRILFVVAVCILFATSNVFSQYLEESSQSGVGIPYFKLALHKQYAKDLKHTHLLIMSEFLYDDLTFIKSDTAGYTAEFELLAAIYDDKDNVVLSRTLNKKVQVADFDMTNKRDKKIDLKTSVSLVPGKYELFIKASDLNSDKVTQRRIKLNIQDFITKEINISGILFIKDVQLDSTGNLIGFKPAYGNNFTGRAEDFYIYSDIYNATVPDEIRLHYVLSSKKGGVELDTVVVKNVRKNITHFLFKVNKERLRFNKYNLELSAESNEASVKKLQTFSFYWTETPNTEFDLNAAFDQMIYIVSEDSLNKYKKSSLAEKKKFFNRFWAEHDPDPSTSKNELKNEYFRRVNFVNQHFSVLGQQGWATDRGRILIKFGFPDDIERHPFELGTKPYEIWRYYALRKTFLFHDMSGFGDYRLDPAFLDEEFK